jgi:hypothetical protein
MMRGGRTAIFLTTLTALTLLAAPQSSIAQSVAIARCAFTGKIGTGQGPDYGVASEHAVSNCVIAGGKPECCRVEVRTIEHRCAALAVSEDNTGVGGGVGDTPDDAKYDAVSRCNGVCIPQAVVCSSN